MSRETGAWMPIYWGDYLADTTHLTTFQHGCYLLLIAAYWRRGGPIPDDPGYIAQVCKTTKDKVARWGKPVIAMFTAKNGLLTHKRIDLEIDKSSARLASAVANGRAGGLAKSKLVTVTVTDTYTKKESGENKNDFQLSDSDSQIEPNLKERDRRKRLWEQKIMAHLTRTLSEKDAAGVITGYMQGDPAAKAAFEEADAHIKRRKANAAH